VKSLALADLLAWVAAVLSGAAALAGLVVGGLYRDEPFWVQQAQGIDLATLFLAVPILIVGLWAARGGSSLGRLAVIGGLLYLVYNYAIYATAVAMNPLTVVYIAILGLSVWSLALGLFSADLATLGRKATGPLPRPATVGCSWSSQRCSPCSGSARSRPSSRRASSRPTWSARVYRPTRCTPSISPFSCRLPWSPASVSCVTMLAPGRSLIRC
jgi:hypothetical protein